MARTKAEIQRDYAKRSGYAAQSKYLKDKSKRYVIQCMLNTESDIIKRIESQSNKAGYIKSLIRADIEKNKKD